jgi:hypothetical protein
MELYNKNKTLSPYGLACGYIERKENEIMYKILYKEHNIYHVQSGKHNEIYNVWITFEPNELTKARQFFNKISLNS